MLIKKKIYSIFGLSIFFVMIMMFLTSCSTDNKETLPLSQEVSTAPPARVAAPAIAPKLKTPATDGLDNSKGQPQKGGRLTVMYSDPPTLDPHLVVDGTSFGLVVELFSGLVSLSSDLKIVPELAESWVINEKGTIYDFKLRDGIKFSNGEPVTAHDFKWSLERAASPEIGSAVAETYLNDIIGINAIVAGDSKNASGIKVIDEQTLRITIDAPKAYFLAKLTYPTAYVVNKKNVEGGGDNWTDNLVGTGAFTLAEYRIGQHIRLTRNANYWGRPAYLDEVFLNLAGGVSMAMYENDEIDVTGVGLADLERVKDPGDPLNKDLVDVPASFGVSYIGFNVDKPPFDDVNFRQALNYAVDKELISTQVYASLQKPAYGIIPPKFPGHNSSLTGLRFDPNKARQLLAESKYRDKENRPRIVMTIPGSGGQPGLDVEVIADMWRKELDIDIEIQQVEWATYLQDLNRRRLQAWGGLSWQADYPDPQNFIDILFASGSQGNRGGYSNVKVDKLIKDAQIEQDVRQRMSLYQQSEEIIVNEAAWLPLWFDTDRPALVKQRVRGYEFTPVAIAKYRNIWIKD